MKYFFSICLTALIACNSTTTTVKSDVDFSKVIKDSETHRKDTLDFLIGEKLPADEFVPPKDSVVKPVPAVEYKEYRPTKPTRFRIQVFAGSAANATKNYQFLLNDSAAKGEVYLVNDPDDQKWRVWVGSYSTHDAASSYKSYYTERGYPDAWIHEMKGEFGLPSRELHWVQLGSLSSESAAQKLQSDITLKRSERVKITAVENVWKVWIGGFDDKTAADTLKKSLQSAGYPKCFVVRGME